MPVPSITTPTTDLGLVYTPTLGAPLMVDLLLTPANDLGLVTGIDRLAQDVTRFLYTPLGSDPFNPDYGNVLLQEIGQPVESDINTYVALLQQAEADFMARQANDAAQGFLSLDEQVDRFEEIGIQVVQNTLVINLRVVAKSSASTTVNATLNS